MLEYAKNKPYKYCSMNVGNNLKNINNYLDSSLFFDFNCCQPESIF
uniref:Uncharacterized protein n=1 Tax=uncultured Desulfobacterium sp. TaxID=201089 RepID=E1YLZ1_9BACT|nr:unknown protein [uncultured Desulfobacterium sp.]